MGGLCRRVLGGLGNIVGVEQCLGRAAGGAGVAQGAHDGLHDGAVEDDDQLVGKELGICGLATFGLAGEVAAELELVVAGDLPGWVAGVGQFGGGVDEWAAAECLRRRPSAQAVEYCQDLLAGRGAGVFGRNVVADDGGAVRIEALGDEPVLAAELLVQRALGNAGLLADQIDADGPDALPVEQVGGGVQQPLARGGPGGRGHIAQLMSGGGAGKQIGVPSQGKPICFQVARRARAVTREPAMTTRLTVLVTGASSGIGRATATEFARQGHLVFAAARREEVLAGLAATSPNIQAVGLDVTDEGSVRRAWATVEAATGGAGVDVLVNNAGFALPGPVEILGGPEVQRQFATNVFGLLTVTRAVLPVMRARKSGRIINISSLVGRATFPGMGVYGATKYAVEALSDALRQEVAGFGIKVVIIEPGFVTTNIGEAADASTAAGQGIPQAYADMAARGSRYLAAQIAKGIAAEHVAATIVKAAGQPNPRLRYVVPAGARPLIALLTSLPGRLADRAKQRTLAAA